MPFPRVSSNVVLVVCSVLLGLGAVEAGLRLAGRSSSYLPAYFRPDPVTGWSPIPNSAGRQRDEGDARFRFNSDGMRDRERTLERTPGTLRIAVLGDSYAEALQVPLAQSFCSVWERNLPGSEVLSFGVRGYGTAQQLLTLRSKVWKYRPDQVVVAVFPGNDIADNSRELSAEDPANRNMRPYFLLRDGRLVLDSSFQEASVYRGAGRVSRDIRAGLRNTFASLDILAASLHAVRYGSDEAAALRQLRDGEPVGRNLVYLPPSSAAWRDAWAVTEALLAAMRDDVLAHGARFGVAVLTTDMQVFPDRAVRERFAARLGVAGPDYASTRLDGFCRREGIPVVTLAGPMREYAEANNVPLHGFSNRVLGYHHWNEKGHRRAGELLAAWTRSW